VAFTVGAGQAVVDVDPLGLDTETEQGVALGGQILLIGGASGVPDKQRAHGTPPGLGPVGSRVAPTRASGSARLKQQDAPGLRLQGWQPGAHRFRRVAATCVVARTRSNFAQRFGYTTDMTAVPLGDARDRLSEYVSEVERTHQRVTITRHGHPAAVLISADDLAAIEETLEILGTPGAAEAINEGLADAAAGRFADNDALKARYGIA
jgi:prevent-host-death family protein